MNTIFSLNEDRNKKLKTLYQQVEAEVEALDAVSEEITEVSCPTGLFDVDLGKYVSFKRQLLLKLIELMKPQGKNE